jgi:hypothetical protein
MHASARRRYGEVQISVVVVGIESQAWTPAQEATGSLVCWRMPLPHRAETTAAVYRPYLHHSL